METITPSAYQGTEEDGEAASQTTGADPPAPACDPQPADFQITREVSQFIAHTELMSWSGGRRSFG